MKEEIKPKIAIFIDDGNMWSSYKSLGCLLDYAKLKKYFESKLDGKINNVYFYKAYPKNGTRNYSLDPQHKFRIFLKKGLGFIVRTKELKTILLRDQTGDLIQDPETRQPKSIEKGNFDVELTIDAVRFAEEYNLAVILSGDSDFLPLVNFLRNSGKSVYICSTHNCVSQELRTGSNGYLDLQKITELHGTPLKFRQNIK
jgi:uncharacterized LabA/DUF88 family protein